LPNLKFVGIMWWKAKHGNKIVFFAVLTCVLVTKLSLINTYQ